LPIAAFAEGAASTSSVDVERLLASVEVDDLISGTTTYGHSDGAPSASPASLDIGDFGPEPADAGETTAAGVEAALSVELDERLLLASLREALARQFAVKGDFRVYLDQPWKALKLPTADWEVVVSSFPSKGLRSQFVLLFEVWADGMRHSHWQQSLRCELWQDALVAQQRVERGAILRDAMFAAQPVDVLALFQSPVEPGCALGEYVASNGIRQGEPLCLSDLAERPLVQRNTFIEVIATDGVMKVSLKGKALEDGLRGQVIRVRNLQSFSDIQAEVTGVNQAKVYF
jgi:flagella basal body P-ring formation protein FlgA